MWLSDFYWQKWKNSEVEGRVTGHCSYLTSWVTLGSHSNFLLFIYEIRLRISSLPVSYNIFKKKDHKKKLLESNLKSNYKVYCVCKIA